MLLKVKQKKILHLCPKLNGKLNLCNLANSKLNTKQTRTLLDLRKQDLVSASEPNLIRA